MRGSILDLMEDGYTAEQTQDATLFFLSYIVLGNLGHVLQCSSTLLFILLRIYSTRTERTFFIITILCVMTEMMIGACLPNDLLILVVDCGRGRGRGPGCCQ
jgi:hypothetical protein